MDGGHLAPGPYWKCPKCGIDCFHKDAGHLFGSTEEDLDIILKDEPKLRQIMKDLRALNKK